MLVRHQRRHSGTRDRCGHHRRPDRTAEGDCSRACGIERNPCRRTRFVRAAGKNGAPSPMPRPDVGLHAIGQTGSQSSRSLASQGVFRPYTRTHVTGGAGEVRLPDTRRTRPPSWQSTRPSNGRITRSTRGGVARGSPLPATTATPRSGRSGPAPECGEQACWRISVC